MVSKYFSNLLQYNKMVVAKNLKRIQTRNINTWLKLKPKLIFSQMINLLLVPLAMIKLHYKGRKFNNSFNKFNAWVFIVYKTALHQISGVLYCMQFLWFYCQTVVSRQFHSTCWNILDNLCTTFSLLQNVTTISIPLQCFRQQTPMPPTQAVVVGDRQVPQAQALVLALESSSYQIPSWTWERTLTKYVI